MDTQTELQKAVADFLLAGKKLEEQLGKEFQEWRKLPIESAESGWYDLLNRFDEAVALASKETGGDPKLAHDFFEEC